MSESINYLGRPAIRVTVRSYADRTGVDLVGLHVDRLVDLGMTMSMIARAAGVTEMQILNVRRRVFRTVLTDHATAILAVDGRPTKHQAQVLAFAARRRLDGLAVLGWSERQISAKLGLDRKRIHQVRHQVRISWSTHESVRVAFDSLGADGGSTRTKLHALRNGFVHPMLWDDIDDPKAMPVLPGDSDALDDEIIRRLTTGRHVESASPSERRAAFDHLEGRGLSAAEIGELIGVTSRTIERYRSTIAV